MLGLVVALALIDDLLPVGLRLQSSLLRSAGQVRSIDKQRVRRRYGRVSPAELEAIDAGLCLYLGLEPEP